MTQYGTALFPPMLGTIYQELGNRFVVNPCIGSDKAGNQRVVIRTLWMDSESHLMKCTSDRSAIT